MSEWGWLANSYFFNDLRSTQTTDWIDWLIVMNVLGTPAIEDAAQTMGLHFTSIHYQLNSKTNEED